MILNDEEHTFPYVIELLIKLFRHPLPKAEELTWRIHTTGRAIVYTTHKELAELKRDQVIAYGPDPRMQDHPKAHSAATSSRHRRVESIRVSRINLPLKPRAARS